MAILSKGRKKSDAASQILPTIAALEKQIQANDANLNPLVDLSAYATDLRAPARVTHAAIYALQRIFASLIRQGRILGKLAKHLEEEDAAAVKKVREWTKARYSEFTDRLSVLLSAQDISLHLSALSISMDLLRIETEILSSLNGKKEHQFSESIWRKVMLGLVACPSLPTDLRAEFMAQYLNAYDDIRFYFLRSLAQLAQDSSTINTAEALNFLEDVKSMPTEPSHLNKFWTTTPESLLQQSKIQHPKTKSKKRKRQSEPDDGSTGIFDDQSTDEDSVEITPTPTGKVHALLSVNEHRRVFQSAWLAVLSNFDSEQQVKRALAVLHTQILPFMIKPNLLLDFLTDSCDFGGTVALLALNGLFTLMTKHNLDFPDFYTKLYALLDSNTLHTKYRARFFRMLDLFLSSSHLPIALIASFVKRLSQLSLSAPPAAIITVIPFVYNLIKKHPQCVQLVHRPAEDSDASISPTEDPFMPEEVDPLKTNAIDSSLWELTSLSSHYLGSISTLAKIFAQQMTKPHFEMEDFLDHNYTSLFQASIQRDLRKPPALDLPPIAAKKVDLFPTQQQDSAIWSDAVTELWVF